MNRSSHASRFGWLATVFAVIGFVCASTASAADNDPAKPAPPAEQGILPIPNYSGDWLQREHLLGDFGGARTELAKKGVQLHVDWVQTVQSVVDGGSDTATKYGGSLDYVLTLDLYRMGLLPGAMVKVRAESRYGDTVNTKAGSILPVNIDGFVPLTTPSDDSIGITVTALTYYQFLSDKFGVFVGKMDTLDSDLNEFASGRGNTQFMNMQLIFSGTLSLLPYSTLGAGVVIMPNKHITITSLVASLSDSSTTTGFNHLNEGWAWSSEVDFQYRLGKLPGGTNVGFVYLWGIEFFNFGGRFTFDRGEGLVPPTKDNTWMAYWSGWQYVYTREVKDGPLNLLNGQPDCEGLGFFWRIAFADDEVNPTEWSASGGIGGKGMIPGRKHDFFGVGYYYNSVQSGRLTSALGLQDHTQGLECFYNIVITPAVQLSLDAQFIDSAQKDLDTGVVLGMRLKLEF